MTAITLAKMHGCRLEGNKADLRGIQIVVPSKNFAGFDFETGHQFCVIADYKAPDYYCSPMIYPIHELELSQNIKNVITFLEAFPEAGGKPIFDHFVAVVPSIQFPRNDSGDLFHFFNTDGHKLHFSNYFATKVALNTMLVKEKYIIPALLGERDGKFYFICFWE